MAYKVDEYGSCIGCGICARNCPAGAIEMKNDKASINPEKCINCGACKSNCPVSAPYEV